MVKLPAAPFRDVPWDDTIPDDALGLEDDFGPREPIAILDDGEEFRYLIRAATMICFLSRPTDTPFDVLDRINEDFGSTKKGESHLTLRIRTAIVRSAEASPPYPVIIVMRNHLVPVNLQYLVNAVADPPVFLDGQADARERFERLSVLNSMPSTAPIA